MVKLMLGIFIVLWLLGFIHIGFFDNALFSIADHQLTLHSVLFFILILFLINLLPGIFRTIAIILLILWLLSTFGFLFFGGLANIILFILILAVIFSLV